GRGAEAQQIDILGRTVRLARPHGKERGALEHELIAVGTLREPIQQALDAVADEQDVERLAPLGAEVEQSLLHGLGKAFVRSTAHATASRYGRMTDPTRQILA